MSFRNKLRRWIAAASLALLAAWVPTRATPESQAPPADPVPPSRDEAAPPAPPPPAPARLARLQGSVKLERNRPVIGAAVTVTPESGDGEVIVTTTDAHGTFRVDDVPDGAYTVVFERSGLETVRKQHVELKAPFRPTVEVVMRAGSTVPVAGPAKPEDSAALSGRAINRDGGVVPDLQVRLIPAKGDADPLERITNSSGAFEASGIPPGPWTLEARGLAYLPVRATLPLEGGTMRVRLVLVPQPPAFDPLPEDLLPPEEPIPPPDTAARANGS